MDNTKDSYHEIIKVPNNYAAWIYIHSQNEIDYVAPHWHRDTEITYMLKGDAHYIVNGHSQTIQEGQLVLINDGSVHSCRMNHSVESDAISVIFPYNFITQFQKNTGSVRFFLTRENAAYPGLCRLFQELYQSVLKQGTDPYSALDLNALLYQISSVLFHHFPAPNYNEIPSRADKFQPQWQEIATYIDNHFSERISLELLASHFGLSKEHLSRTFHSYMGISFKKYLTRIRMHYAYQQLISTDLTIVDIALNNGFSDSRAFIHNFKEAYGITPLKYRKIKENTDNTHSLANKKDKFLKSKNEV